MARRTSSQYADLYGCPRLPVTVGGTIPGLAVGGTMFTGTDAERELYSADFEYCSQVTTHVFENTTEDLSIFFDQLLDQRACLINEGYEVSQPPSRDYWIENTMRVWAQPPGSHSDWVGWGPMGEVFESILLDIAEQQRLWEACPQPWRP